VDKKDLFWLAGLFEGEGSFVKPAPCEAKYPRLRITMTDFDIIQKVMSLFNVKYIHTRKDEKRRNRYVVSKGGKEAVEFMKQLRPLMGQRRQAQIDEAIADDVPKCNHGDNHPQAKLTAEKVSDIKQRLLNGESTNALAKEYSVDSGLI